VHLQRAEDLSLDVHRFGDVFLNEVCPGQRLLASVDDAVASAVSFGDAPLRSPLSARAGGMPTIVSRAASARSRVRFCITT